MIPEELRRGRYVSLTTFRKNGTGVATPVWYAVEGAELYAWTRTDSWKVKRLRNDPRVEVAVCDVRGNVAEGATRFPGEGRIGRGGGAAPDPGAALAQVHLAVLADRRAGHDRPPRQAPAHRNRRAFR